MEEAEKKIKLDLVVGRETKTTFWYKVKRGNEVLLIGRIHSQKCAFEEATRIVNEILRLKKDEYMLHWDEYDYSVTYREYQLFEPEKIRENIGKIDMHDSGTVGMAIVHIVSKLLSKIDEIKKELEEDTMTFIIEA